ncbi:hypothetical protein WQQ_14390 [Hydrocarboniphaga effusa AP103]|uniref:Uncharacterized protein n=1 Tax=Hydrocarboniphaga effusa AP103 TaxID=1172194 RepID=I7ZHR8_9GAMM|nr:hypothetical protein WQQ_14390 [Hydrocarboniphaga effusa AP103]
MAKQPPSPGADAIHDNGQASTVASSALAFQLSAAHITQIS